MRFIFALILRAITVLALVMLLAQFLGAIPGCNAEALTTSPDVILFALVAAVAWASSDVDTR